MARQRNWLDLDRKLVDRVDLNYTVDALQESLDDYALAWWGEGVLKTKQYPSPFPIAMSSSPLSGQVGNGIAFDPTGQITRIDDTSVNPKTFAVAQADSTNDRWDLLCLQYMQVGDTLVPKPSDPLSTVYLNLHDEFQLVIRSGTAAPTPSYPAKQSGDIILAGVRVPAGATLGSQIVIDYGVRENALANASQYPHFVQEVPTGTIDGNNTTFALSATPLNTQALLLTLDDLIQHQTDYILTDQLVSFNQAPQPGQTINAFYIAYDSTSQNPLGAWQEEPAGTVDGVNDTFALSMNPTDQNSVLVYVDGLLVHKDEWQLLLGTSTSIKFLPDSIPQAGQDVYVYYFLDTANSLPMLTTTTPPTSGGGGSGTLQVQYPTLGAMDLTNGYITLASTPASPGSTLLDILGGGSQAYGTDYLVSGQQLHWIGNLASGGSTPLAVGDQLRVQYFI